MPSLLPCPLFMAMDLAAGDDGNFQMSGDSCGGERAYHDLQVGPPVTVYNADGKIVGVGEVDTASSNARGACVMMWSVMDVPAGQGPYQCEISHRGRLTISEDDARAVRASASIGD